MIFATLLAEALEITEAVYSSKKLSTATGVDLDNLGALKGISRLPESNSFTESQTFTGTPGTIISAGSLFSNPVTNDRFTNTSSITLASTSCVEARLSVVTLLNSTSYSITINGTVYSTTSDSDATANEILDALRILIDADTSATYSAALDGSTTLVITTDDQNPISVVTTTYINVDKVTVEGRLDAVEVGGIIAAPNTVTSVVTTISGLDSTNNPDQYILGRFEETDDEYRVRIATGQGISCTGTIPSITAYLLNNVDGIGSVSIVENTLSVPDGDGRAAHSYEIIVTGGSDEDLAEAIWFTKGAGIELNGNTTVNFTDSSNTLRTVKFTRPTAVNIAVRVTYTIYDEEVFPVQGEDLIRTAVFDHINGLNIDKDVITGRMFGPIYSSVDGIDSLVVEIQTLANAGDPPVGGSWQTTKIDISDSQFASIISGDIFLVDATP